MLDRASLLVQILIDHSNLGYLMSKKQFSHCHAWWSEFLSRFNFFIRYKSGKQSAKPDALTKQSGNLPKKENDERVQQIQQTVLKVHNIDVVVKIDLESKIYSLNLSRDMLRARANTLENLILAANQEHITVEDVTPNDKLMLKSLLDQGYILDSTPKRVLRHLVKGGNYSKDLTIANYANVNTKLHYQNRLHVPDYYSLYLCFCQLHYNSQMLDHLGVCNIYELPYRSYY